MGNSIKKASNINEFKSVVLNTNNKINSRNLLNKESNIYISLSIDIPDNEIVKETILWKLLVKVSILVYYKTQDGNYKNEKPIIKTKLSFGEFYTFLNSVQNYIDLENQKLNSGGNNSNTATTTTALNNLYNQEDEDDKLCPICLDREATNIGNCAHAFCSVCINEWRHKNNTCPLCRDISSDNNGQSDFFLIDEKKDDNNDPLLGYINSTLLFIKK